MAEGSAMGSMEAVGVRVKVAEGLLSLPAAKVERGLVVVVSAAD